MNATCILEVNGLAQVLSPTIDQFERPRRHFEEAIALEPGFARAPGWPIPISSNC